MLFRSRAYVAGTSSVNPTRYDSARRSVYLPVVRSAVYEVFQAFDFADPSVSTARRDATTVAPQALFMMNNDFVREQANAMAKRILATKADYATRLNYAYYLALGRPSTPEERKRADQYLNVEAKALVPLKKGDQNAAGATSDSAVNVELGTFGALSTV